MLAQITALQEVKQLLLLCPHCHLHKDAHMKLFWRSPPRMIVQQPPVVLVCAELFMHALHSAAF